jgi:lantibiotic modifying enzyme
MALGLLEAYHLLGHRDYLEVAQAAFAYEDQRYLPERQNWVDLRMPFNDQNRTDTATCQTAWCHGAPGIALARLQAMQLDPDHAHAYAETAHHALQGTVVGARQALAHPHFDATLCHGLSGLADILRTGGHRLGSDTYLQESEAITTALLDQYQTSSEWPTGVPQGAWTPSLMIGVSGIGGHLLRSGKAGRQMRSILVLEHDDG